MLLKRILLASTIAIFAAFFMPWVNVESAAVGGISKLLTGKEAKMIDDISGFDVPVMANSDNSRFMISIIKIFAPNVSHADKKSFLIWLVPLLGVGLYFSNIKWGHIKWVPLGIGVLGLGILIGGTYVIFTTDLNKLVLKVNIAYGVWLLLIGYGVVGGINLKQAFDHFTQKQGDTSTQG